MGLLNFENVRCGLGQVSHLLFVFIRGRIVLKSSRPFLKTGMCVYSGISIFQTGMVLDNKFFPVTLFKAL